MLISGATFSADRRFRYRLWRYWKPEGQPLIFLMLNPSTADEFTNDPTIQRCQQRAIFHGYAGLEILNIFAFRSTNPKGLYKEVDPIGPDNDAHISTCLNENITSPVICGWGVNGALSGRAAAVLARIRQHGITPMCLKQNTDGSPQHPLYLPYSLRPTPMVESMDAATTIALPTEQPRNTPATDRGLFHGK